MNRFFVSALIIASLLAPSAVVAGVGDQAQVRLHNGAFEPKALTIEAGTTVFWNNADATSTYSVIADNGLFRSGDLVGKGYAFSYTFDDAGTYPYYSANQGGKGGVGMSGVITVTAPSRPQQRYTPYTQNTLAPQVNVAPLAPTYGTAPVYSPTTMWDMSLQPGSSWNPQVMQAPEGPMNWASITFLRPRCFYGPYGHQCF